MANLVAKQNKFPELINQIDELSEKYSKIKPILIFWGFKKKLKEINSGISEVRREILYLDLEILPKIEVTEDRSSGITRGNMAITYFNTRNLVLSNLHKLEQDISNFENQQNFKKSLFIAVIALIVSIITTLPDLFEIVKPFIII